jgi:FkbM family methyltransferase
LFNKSADANKVFESLFLKLRLAAVTARLALTVRESARFWARVAFRWRGVARYRLRGSNVIVHIRHGTVDIDTFDEIFRRGHYDLPAPAAAVLQAKGHPLRVVDLGANVGLFGAHIRGVFPQASITAVEPHPGNVAVLKRTIAANRRRAGWELVEACADVRDGEVPFAFAQFATSRIDRDATATMVPAVDAFPLLDRADLLKLDIEGGEWPILSDERFARALPAVVALEYHAQGCPTRDPAALAKELLQRAGYETEDADFELPPGQGMLWAWRA